MNYRDYGDSALNGKVPTPYSPPKANQRLHLHEIVDAPVGVFPAVAGVFVAAKGSEGVPGGRVDLDLPCPDLANCTDASTKSTPSDE